MSAFTDFLTKVRGQNFGPNDSQIVSTLVHPAEGLSKFGKFLQKSVNAAGQAPMRGDNQALRENAVIGALNVAGLAQTGAMPFAPSGYGTLGTIKAWHGSPHKFTKFSDEAIGTGEGSQAMGMGHYSGENVKAIDAQYRKRLIDDLEVSPMESWAEQNPDLAYGLRDFTDKNVSENLAGFKDLPPITQMKRQMDAHNQALTNIWNLAKNPAGSGKFEDTGLDPIAKDLYNSIKDYEHIPNKGFMYELNLKPDQEDLLHLNKTLGEHPKAVQDKIKIAYNNASVSGGISKKDTGQDIYDKLANSGDEWDDYQATSFLKEAGIPGHSFSGDDAPNYVIYDPENIDIKRRIKGGLDSPVKGFVDYIKGKSKGMNEFQKAHVDAQFNAALPVEQGGLGLPPNNTSMDRAIAQGYTDPVYHTTHSNIKEIDPTKGQMGFHVGTQHQANSIFEDLTDLGPREGASPDAGINMMPMLKKSEAHAPLVEVPDSYPHNYESMVPWLEEDGILTKAEVEKLRSIKLPKDADLALMEKLRSKGYAGAKYINEYEGSPRDDLHSYIMMDPSAVRSRFAAFDPLKKNSANVLASLLAGFGLQKMANSPNDKVKEVETNR